MLTSEIDIGAMVLRNVRGDLWPRGVETVRLYLRLPCPMLKTDPAIPHSKEERLEVCL